MNLDRTVPGILDEAASRFPKRAAIVDDAGVLGFGDLRERSRRLARAVMAAGLRPGERFAIWAPNTPDWVLAALAGQQAGGVLVPLNTRFKGGEAADIVRRAGVRLAFAMGEFLGVDYAAALEGQDCPGLQRVVRLGATAGERSLDEFAELGEGVSEADLDARIEAVGLCAEDSYLVVNPFFHSFGYKAGWLAALLRGATVYPETRFDAERVLRQIERHRITMLPGPPTLFQSLLTHPATRSADLGSLRCAVTGAAVVPVQLVKDMKRELGFDEVYTAYGLTESSGVVSLCDREDDFDTIASTCGRAMRGVEIRIADEAGDALPAGEPGEVRVRGFNVMQGYLDDPVATAAAITPDGWLKTGDVGVLDGRGYLRITDRLKDMYICGGFNCYPAEIENRLLDHPDVAEVAIIGSADKRLGEVGHAFVVRAPGSAAEPGELIEWARGRMANFKVPRQVSFLDELPRNATGKVQKFRLRGR